MKVVEVIGQTAHISRKTNAHIISIRTLEGRDCLRRRIMWKDNTKKINEFSISEK